MSAEPERVRQRHVDPAVHLPVRRAVEIALGIGRGWLIVGGIMPSRDRRAATMMNSTRARRAQQVAGHRLGGAEDRASRACSPKTAFIASVSAMSPCGVEVPCALM